MAILPGEIRLLYPPRRSLGVRDNQSVPAYEFHFSIRGEGDYVAVVPINGYTAELGLEAIKRVAAPILETLDALK